MIRKNKINIESEDWEMAERAIKQSGTVKEKLPAKRLGKKHFRVKLKSGLRQFMGFRK